MSRTPLIIAAVAGVIFAVSIGEGSHLDSDDALYAQMAREMVVAGDLVDNRWSGTVLFEKPPLYLWSLAASGTALGWGEASMRLPGTLFAIGGLVAMWLLALGLGLTRSAAAVAVALLGTSFFYFLLTRRLMTDVPLIACLLAAAACLSHGRYRWFGVLCGAAVLCKGLAAGPLVLALVIWGLWEKRLSPKTLAEATALGLLIAAPWHIAATLRHGSEFWSGYVGYHVGARATSKVVPGLGAAELLSTFWSAEAPLLLGGLFFLGRSTQRRVSSAAARWVWLWLSLAALPLLVSTTRLPHYLLPLIPGLALATAAACPEGWFEKRLAGLAIAALALAAFFANPAKLVFWLDPDFGPDDKALGAVIAQNAGDEDLVATYNRTTAALTFYTDRRVEMYSDDPTFSAIQDAVLMVQRSGVHHPLTDDGFPTAARKRFVVARLTDQDALAARLKRSNPRRPVYIVVANNLVLVNDAGVGERIR